ncbi:MAG TPA: hypothetical protein VM581_05080 [Magnetospirillaceae bacterium]|nr:hypothetical protein [Magnetospirillaceae bacterium]
MTKGAKTYDILIDETFKQDGHSYHRVLAKTPWINEGDDLAAIIKKALGSHITPKSTVFLAEKIAIVTAGKMVRANTVKVGRFARFASKFVKPRGSDLAQSIPERMQFVINSIGFPRTLLACAATAVTRPFGIRGAFFVIAGYKARDLDGMHDNYLEWLLPPLRPRDARAMAEDLAKKVGAPVAIVDINYFGGHVRGVSSGGLSKEHLLRSLKDDPHGHTNSAPMGLVELIN